ncbi:MAG: DNA methyltransferase [Acidimicrobiaceae bacterium]|nr:DNA methyltransferase [Acidimicrobiaceae bacterium]
MNAPNWRNRTIFTGDNLEVMRGMNSASVDLIYLDPPFNSNADYSAPIGSDAAGAAFKDTWTLSDVDEAWHGEIADRQPAVYAIIDAAGIANGLSMKSYLIMMAVRLLEMERLLSPTGSIWLHCDPTAAHYLKMLMDAVLGAQMHRNEVIWKRTGTHNDARHSLPDVSDTILFYSRPDAVLNPIHVPHSDEYIEEKYRYNDKDGRGPYQLTDITSPKPRPNMMYEWRGYPFPAKGWRYQRDTMQQLHDEGRIWYPTKMDGSPDYSKRPRRKSYLADSEGPLLGNVWTDIAPLNSQATERTGYPTQKPLALLERIITACTDRGDIVLDPFCGCATTCVSADRLQRQWAGIDLSPVAAKLVLKRIRDDQGPMFSDITHRDDLPQRTDLGKAPDYRTHKHTLYGRQEGKCNGCGVLFPFRNFTVDHIIARERGGTDHYDNLQLLCGACNSLKGTGTQEELIVKLEQQGIIQRIGT